MRSIRRSRTVGLRGQQQGFMLIEALVVLALFAVTGLAVARSLVTLFDNLGRADARSLTSQIALQEMERLAAIDPSTLSAANNTSTTVERDAEQFSQEVTITVNADGSRTISVEVIGISRRYEIGSTITNTFPLWGSL